MTNGHPSVYVEWSNSRTSPTALFYGHYDVQPTGPLSDWYKRPFEPTISNNYLLGRGASDDKGQIFAVMKAIESYLRIADSLPINLKCLFDGEEEIGSPSLLHIMDMDPDTFSADPAFVFDMYMRTAKQPAIIHALRGSVSLELIIRSTTPELHSGLYGGAVRNHLEMLCNIISKLHDHDGRITIPGFYDSVRRLSGSERNYMQEVGFTDGEIRKLAHITEDWGEHLYTMYERLTTRPAVIVNGIAGGYTGTGIKSVIPTDVTAKINLRLVPYQDPNKIEQLFRRFILHCVPSSFSTEIRRQAITRPVEMNRSHPLMSIAAEAYRKGFKATPVYLRSGGSIPIVNALREVCCSPTAVMGFALPDDGAHAPDEQFYLPNFHRGISTCVWLITLLRLLSKK